MFLNKTKYTSMFSSVFNLDKLLRNGEYTPTVDSKKHNQWDT